MNRIMLEPSFQGENSAYGATLPTELEEKFERAMQLRDDAVLADFNYLSEIFDTQNIDGLQPEREAKKVFGRFYTVRENFSDGITANHDRLTLDEAVQLVDSENNSHLKVFDMMGNQVYPYASNHTREIVSQVIDDLATILDEYT